MPQAAIFMLVLSLSCILSCRDKNQNSNMTAELNFTDITLTTGVDFLHEPGVQGDYHMPESLGSGGALFDCDNDGDLDIYLINGNFRDARAVIRNRLFLQQSDGTFIENTDASGLGDTGYGMGCAVGDIDNDGDLDIYVSNDGPDQLYQNLGAGLFRNITISAKIDNPDWGCSATFSDIDNDGYLDIYVVNYVKYDPRVICTDQAGRREYCGPAGFPGVADKLYRNNGDGSFSDISRDSGIFDAPRKGLGVVSVDVNNDQFMDFYVSNDGEQNQLWVNQKDGTFRDKALILGVAVNRFGQAEAGMGIAVGDADNDSNTDFFVTHLRGESNTLYRNNGELGFMDDTQKGQLAQSSLRYTGFGTGFLDFDNDGDLDLAVVNGRVTRGTRLTESRPVKYWDDYAEPNLLFMNNGSGQFENSYSGSAFCTAIENSRGLAFGDIDNDGDTDLLVTNEGGAARIYRNDVPEKGNWLLLRALDSAGQRDAIGARISVFAGGKSWQRSVISGYSYLTANDLRVHFGLGTESTVDSLKVFWPDGIIEVFSGITINRFITLEKGRGDAND